MPAKKFGSFDAAGVSGVTWNGGGCDDMIGGGCVVIGAAAHWAAHWESPLRQAPLGWAGLSARHARHARRAEIGLADWGSTDGGEAGKLGADGPWRSGASGATG